MAICEIATKFNPWIYEHGQEFSFFLVTLCTTFKLMYFNWKNVPLLYHLTSVETDVVLFKRKKCGTGMNGVLSVMKKMENSCPCT